MPQCLSRLVHAHKVFANVCVRCKMAFVIDPNPRFATDFARYRARNMASRWETIYDLLRDDKQRSGSSSTRRDRETKKML